MQFIDNKGITDPALNLAIEEYALKHLPAEHDYLLFYINEPSIIIGKNQNTIEEINSEFVKERGIHVVRRLSGGGAVYHDLGNLNFSFITTDDGKSFHNYRKFTEPVIQALHELGVDAELTGRNDIQVGERKISGNAQFAVKGRMFSHGTLLFNTNMEDVVGSLKVKAAKIESKGVKSIRSRVANIAELMDQSMTIEQFKARLLSSIFEGGPVNSYELTEHDWEAIQDIADSRYRSWEWNYGRSPQCNVVRSGRFEGIGTLDVHLQIDKGLIQTVRIYGDFFGIEEVSELEQKLTGLPYTREELERAMDQIDISNYIGKMSKEQLLDLLSV